MFFKKTGNKIRCVMLFSWFHLFYQGDKGTSAPAIVKYFPVEIHATIGKNHHLTGKTARYLSIHITSPVEPTVKNTTLTF